MVSDDDLLSALNEMHDAALLCDSLAFDEAKCYASPPLKLYRFSDWERDPPKCELRYWHPEEIERTTNHMNAAIQRWKAAAVHGNVGMLHAAIGVQYPPVTIGELSWPTAHEAAAALCEEVMRVLSDEADGHDSTYHAARAIGKAMRRWRRKADLFGQIEQEFNAAIYGSPQPEQAKTGMATLPAATANDARDKWLYEQCCKLVIYSSIVRALAKKKKWEPIESIQGIKNAANRYAEAHALPVIPSRQPGRTRKNNVNKAS
jgi:hypothetical protein